MCHDLKGSSCEPRCRWLAGDACHGEVCAQPSHQPATASLAIALFIGFLPVGLRVLSELPTAGSVSSDAERWQPLTRRFTPETPTLTP